LLKRRQRSWSLERIEAQEKLLKFEGIIEKYRVTFGFNEERSNTCFILKLKFPNNF